MGKAAIGSLVLLALIALTAGGCRKRPDRLPPTRYPKAKLGYRAGNCVYMDLNHAGEPEKGICYGIPGEPMLAADFDGNGTTDIAVRRLGMVLIDTHNDGDTHEMQQDLGWIGDAKGFVVGDFSGSADHRGKAAVCVIRGDTCRIQGSPPGPVAERRVIPGQEYFSGRWQSLGPARLGARVGLCVDLDAAGDDRPDKHICYDDLGAIDQVLVGDWNGDGRDDLIIRRRACVFVDTKLDGTYTETQCLAEGRGATDYFAGSWDGQ